MQEYIDYEKIEKLSYVDKDILISDKIIKLFEETGEVSKELEYFLYNSDFLSAKRVIEECCDVINVAIDIVNAANYNFDTDFNPKEIKPSFTHNNYIVGTALTMQSKAGLVAKNFLKINNSKNSSATGKNDISELIDNVYGIIQATDATIKVLLQRFNENLDISFVKETFSKKLDKWENKQENYISKEEKLIDVVEYLIPYNRDKMNLKAFIDKNFTFDYSVEEQSICCFNISPEEDVQIRFFLKENEID